METFQLVPGRSVFVLLCLTLFREEEKVFDVNVQCHLLPAVAWSSAESAACCVQREVSGSAGIAFHVLLVKNHL